MVWSLRTGALWQDWPERCGSWRTVISRFYRGYRAGVWPRVLEALHRQAGAGGAIDWDTHHVDSTIVWAHQQAAGAKASTPKDEALGRSQGGFSPKAPT
jgi:transposase